MHARFGWFEVRLITTESDIRFVRQLGLHVGCGDVIILPYLHCSLCSLLRQHVLGTESIVIESGSGTEQSQQTPNEGYYVDERRRRNNVGDS